MPADAPDEGDGGEKGKGNINLGADAPADGVDVEAVAHGDGTKDLGEPVEQVVERASARVEVSRIHVIGLVGIEEVRGEKHGKDEYPRLVEENLPEAAELAGP